MARGVLTPEVWRITLEYRTIEQAKMALSVAQGTAPSRFTLEVIDTEGQPRWVEHGMIHLRPKVD